MNSVVLVILDGYGIAPAGAGNAIYLANPKFINSISYSFPNTQLKASGEAVGLPVNEVGNTEVGHLNLGAGRIVYQSLPRINLSIADGDFYKKKVFLNSLDHLKITKGKLHLIGLISSGTVHACIDHLYALLYFCKENHFSNVYIHAITDGRDSPQKSAINYLTNLQEKLNNLRFGKIVSIMGRYYALDRDRRWERTEKSYLCLTKGSKLISNSWLEVIYNSYKENKTDEFIEPTNILSNNEKVLIQEGDAVIFFNYRVDRPRQLTKAFILDNFELDANKISYDPYATKYYKKHDIEEVINPPFKRGPKIRNLYFATMTEYEKNLCENVAFSPSVVRMPLGRVLAEDEIFQLRIAESEKERFVTYYFNGLRKIKFPFEDRLIIPSPKIATYDLKPEMSAFEITSNLIKSMYEMRYRFILVNFANPDMLGHTGNLSAAIKAISSIDQCIGKIINTTLRLNYTTIITSDHGNAEEMIDLKTGQILTEHTGNLVPLIAIHNKFQGKGIKLQSGILADVAPTIISLLNLKKPEEMTGRNLLEELIT